MAKTLLELTEMLIVGDGSSALSRAHHRGEYVRIAPRRYVATQAWIDATPGQRFRLMAAAEQQVIPGAILLGATALQAVGVPMLQPPNIMLSTAHPQRVGRLPSRVRIQGTSPLAEAARRIKTPRVQLALHGPDPSQLATYAGVTMEAAAPAFKRLALTPHVHEALCAADGLAKALKLPTLNGWGPLLQLFEAVDPGSARSRALAVVTQSTALSGSVGESLSRFIILDAGFPAPVLQAEFVDSLGLMYPDFHWPEFGLFGEFDGMQKYTDPGMGGGRSTAARIKDEKLRDGRLEKFGRVLHWVWDDLWAPGRLAGKLRSAGLIPDRRSRPWP